MAPFGKTAGAGPHCNTAGLAAEALSCLTEEESCARSAGAARNSRHAAVPKLRIFTPVVEAEKCETATTIAELGACTKNVAVSRAEILPLPPLGVCMRHLLVTAILLLSSVPLQ